jgi:hypothetical protein
VGNNERYLAFPPAVSQAFLEVSDLRGQFLSGFLQPFLEHFLEVSDLLGQFQSIHL